ncbi:RNA polymerase sigma factor [Bacteroides sp. 519]|uniref:RNA polymerase sigma factor n=1 Tax=Bacteroides sp. 519 TaxID=2302937 RepID=UPI0019403092|nr:sigma-70 family RNA polymerase sigma factor [Bacteroides sp. 519]
MNEAEYFGELYNRYIPLIYGTCLKYLQQQEEAKDAVMQIFEDLLPKVRNYEINSFRTWLYTVVKNHCLQLLRKENKEISIDLSTENMESQEFLHLLYEEEEKSMLDSVQPCIERLPDKQRICIIHFFMKKMSYADIVDRTGYSLKAVKSNIQNGKRNLKTCLTKNAL